MSLEDEWREYKEWIGKYFPHKLKEHMWHKNFEKAILILFVVGLMYLFTFLFYGEELLGEIRRILNDF